MTPQSLSIWTQIATTLAVLVGLALVVWELQADRKSLSTRIRRPASFNMGRKCTRWIHNCVSIRTAFEWSLFEEDERYKFLFIYKEHSLQVPSEPTDSIVVYGDGTLSI